MLNRFMITAAAAALIAGTGFANAQGTGGRETGPSMQQGAPSSERPSSAQPEEKMQQPQGGKRAQDKQDNMKPGPKADKAAQDNNMKGDNMKGEAPRNAQTDEKGKPEGRQTVGQAGAGAKLSSEQRTKISTVIRNQHVAPVTNVNFSVSIGTRVPRDVSFRPLPAEIVTIYPEWRGYEFILVRDQIVVVDPQTYEIVAVLDV